MGNRGVPDVDVARAQSAVRRAARMQRLVLEAHRELVAELKALLQFVDSRVTDPEDRRMLAEHGRVLLAAGDRTNELLEEAGWR